MLFNSYTFLGIFLPIVLAGWWLVLRQPVHRFGFLLLASYVFYSMWEFPQGLMLLPLLVGATSVDYVSGRLIHSSSDERFRRRVLWTALGINLSILGTFKYYGFFSGIIGAAVSFVSSSGIEVPVRDLILPIGISFYTFISMSYTIDVYRGHVRPARSYVEYAAFVSLFPHLIAGPIVRFREVRSQLGHLPARLDPRLAALGIFFLVVGLFKKVVVAGSLAPHVDRLWAAHEELTMVSAWMATLAYAFQIYFDFSAYSEMAVGLALLLGLRFPQNFNSPYKADSMADFWKRWHITLSRWLRDYLYIPLGGSRGGRWLTLRNLFLTMLLGGLWHGAGAVFLLWGLGHGAAVVVHRFCRDRGWTPRSTRINRALTFGTVVFLMVPFRSGELSILQAGESFTTMWSVYASMFGANGLGLADLSLASTLGTSVPLSLVALVTGLLVFVNVAPNTWEFRLRPRRHHAVMVSAMGIWSVLLLSEPTPFLYFQF